MTQIELLGGDRGGSRASSLTERELAVLRHIASDPERRLELTPMGLWITPSTSIYPNGGHPRWWAAADVLESLLAKGMVRRGPIVFGDTPTIVLTEKGAGEVTTHAN